MDMDMDMAHCRWPICLPCRARLPHSLTHSLTYSLTHSLTHPPTLTHPHSPTHPPTHSLPQVPTAYYAVLAVLALFIMVRISAELRSPSNRPLKDLPGFVDAEEREMHLGDEMASREVAEVDGGAAEAEGLLRTHLDDLRFELYVPPLTTTLLNATYEQSAERTERGGGRGRDDTDAARVFVRG